MCHLPKSPPGDYPTANLTDSDSQNLFLPACILADSVVLSTMKVLGGGGYENGDCEKFTSFVNNQFYLSLEYYVRCESEDKIRLFFLKFLQYKDFFAYVLVEAGKE